jgi:hypothetical protein
MQSRTVSGIMLFCKCCNQSRSIICKILLVFHKLFCIPNIINIILCGVAAKFFRCNFYFVFRETVNEIQNVWLANKKKINFTNKINSSFRKATNFRQKNEFAPKIKKFHKQMYLYLTVFI